MAALPKRKHTRARSGKRRSTQKLGVPTLGKCPSCKKLRPIHKVCPYCGFYK